MKSLPTPKTVLVLAIAALIAGSAAFAQPHFRGGPDRDARGDRLVEFLGLTDEQHEQWRAIHAAFRAESQSLFEQMRENRQAQEAAIEARDATLIGELVLAGHDLREQTHSRRDAMQSQLLQILDAEQRERFEAFQAARGERRFGAKRRHGRGPHGGGRH